MFTGDITGDSGDDPHWDMAIPDRRVWGRGVLQQAWEVVYPGESPTLACLQILQGMTEGEGWYGYASKPLGWKGSNNWGSISTKCAECTEGVDCFQAVDHLGDGTEYTTCFKIYPDAVAGAADFIRYACSYHNGHDYAQSGDLGGFALQLRQVPAYYQGISPDIPTAAVAYGQGIYARVVSIASDLGEPVSVSLDGPSADPGSVGGLGRWALLGTILTGIIGIVAWQFGYLDNLIGGAQRYVGRI